MDIMQRFIDQCIIITAANKRKDHKANNKAMLRLIEIYKELEKDVASAEQVLYLLLKNQNEYVRLNASAHCLALKILLEEAEFTLSSLAERSIDRIVSFNAQATLDVWKKQGFFRIYR